MYQSKLIEKLRIESLNSSNDRSHILKLEVTKPSPPPQKIEILRITRSQSLNKNMLEVRVKDSIVMADIDEIKQVYPMQLCDFYEKVFKIVP